MRHCCSVLASVLVMPVPCSSRPHWLAWHPFSSCPLPIPWVRRRWLHLSRITDSRAFTHGVRTRSVYLPCLKALMRCSNDACFCQVLVCRLQGWYLLCVAVATVTKARTSGTLHSESVLSRIGTLRVTSVRVGCVNYFEIGDDQRCVVQYFTVIKVP